MQRNKDEHIKYNLNSTVLFDGLRYSLGGNGLYKEPNLRYPIIELNDNELDFVGNYGIKSFLVWKEFDNSEKDDLEFIVKSYKTFWELYDNHYEDLKLYSIMYRDISIHPTMQDGYSISFFSEKKDEIIGFKKKLTEESSAKSTIALLYFNNISVFFYVFNKYEDLKFQSNKVFNDWDDIELIFEERRPKIFSIEHLSDNQCIFILSHQDELIKEYDNIFEKLFGESINKQNNSLKEMFISYCNRGFINPYATYFLSDYKGNPQGLVEHLSTWYSLHQERQKNKIANDTTFWREVDIVKGWCEIVMESRIMDRLKEAENKRQKEYEKECEEYEIKREIKRQEEEARKENFRFNQRNRHCLDCKISFRESDHIYVVNGVCLDSVTTFVSNCFPKFDMKFHAKRKAEAMRVPVQEVIEMWKQKGKESRDLGVKMHQNIEDYYQDNFFTEDDTFRLFKIFACNIRLEPYRTEWAVYDWEYKIAGTIDFIDYQNGKYTIYDWKRSDKIIMNGIPIKKDKYGEKANFPLEHLDNSPYYHYALQLSLYKFILERNYNIKISSLRLGIFHPTYNKPYLLEMPYLENEINIIFNSRSEVIF